MEHNLDSFLNEHGLKHLPTSGGGDCLFYALQMMLPELLGGMDVDDIRNNVVLHLRGLVDRNVEVTNRTAGDELIDVAARITPLRDWITNHAEYTNWDNYYYRMATQGTYADDPCLWAASSLFGVEITVYVSDGSIQIFSPSWEGTTPPTKISIGNYNQRHYVATAPRDSPGGTSGNGASGGTEGKPDTDTSSSEDEPADEDRNVPSFLLDDDSIDDEFMYDMETLLDQPDGGESKNSTLQEMYKATFPAPSDSVNIDELLPKFTNQVQPFLYGYDTTIILQVHMDGRGEDAQKMLDFYNALPEINDQKFLGWARYNIHKDYMLSPLDWAAFKTEYERMGGKMLAERIMENVLKEEGKKVCVDVEKKKRLLKCISFAIRVGLNYQELEKFEAKVPMSRDMRPLKTPMTLADVEHLKIPLHDLSDEEMKGEGVLTLDESKKIRRSDLEGFDMKLPEGEYIRFTDILFEKVNTEDMWTDPHWKGMCSRCDLPDGHVSLWNLKDVWSFEEGEVFFVNPTKRTTLQYVRSVASNPDIKTHIEGSYNVELDNLPQASIKRLCKLKTLQKAPRVLAAALAYVRTGTDNLEESYRVWLNSKNSFKLYKRDDLEPTVKPFFAPNIDYPGSAKVEEIIAGDLTKLAGLITLRRPDDHEAALHKDPPALVPGAPDVDFQEKLSEAFEKMGFLPPGYDMYCGVKRGESTLPRERSESEEEPAKRQRRNLFTAIEIH